MFASRLFWKVFGVYALLSAIAVVCIIAILGPRQRQIVYGQVYERLHDSAVTVLYIEGDPFSSEPDEGLIQAAQSIADENNTRITLIAADGVVTLDTERDPATMKNHAERPEVVQAAVEGVGSSRRASPTLGIPMLYLAVRAGVEESPSGYVRVAVSLDSVEAEVRSVQQLVVATSLVVSLLALVLMFLILRHIVQPLTTLTTAAHAMAGGDLQQRVDVDRRDELGTLSEAFNVMARELSSRMDELQRTSAELRENGQLLSAVFVSMVEGVIAIDNDESILFANRAARSLLDFGEQELTGRPIWECVRNETVQSVVRHAMTGLQRSVECELPRNETVVEIRAMPMAGEPCPGVVLVIHDVTELRRLENVRRDFVSNVSHELKTPLTIIQTSTETLLDGALEEEELARRFLSRIDEQGQRLHELIVDLLQLAQIESGRQAFEITSVPVRATVESLIDEFSGLAESNEVSLTMEPMDEDLFAEADFGAFRTIIENLISNAIKYTPAGGDVTVAWRRDGAYLLMDVRDNGVGISREHQTRIFERFYRVDRSRNRVIGGTGLGLSIVKHLAQVFAAQVSVESEIGKGSVFSLRIPLAVDPVHVAAAE